MFELKDSELPSFSDLSYQTVPVHDIEAGSYILVKTGEVRV